MHGRSDVILFLFLCLIGFRPVDAHDGPDPVAHWEFVHGQTERGVLKAKLGPDASIIGPVRWQKDDLGESLVFSSCVRCIVAADYKSLSSLLPKEAMTISTWVAVDEPQEWGGIIGTIEDDGDTERGWLLGYDQQFFTLVLSTAGADDGNGKLTVLRGTTRFEKGRMYHVTAVYDGKTAELYVNGEREASTADQWGSILYPSAGEFVIGGFRDRNEDYRLTGRIREIKLFDVAAKPAWVKQEFEHNIQIASLEARPVRAVNGFVVEPYLQFGTQNSMTVMWRTAGPATSVVNYGETVECLQQATSDGTSEIHEVTITGLTPETQYFYLVESELEDGSLVESGAFTFSTAVKSGTPFAFAVFGDTQGNPKVSSRLAEMAWAQRPSFLLHVGDLVDNGTVPAHWTEHFFPGLKPLAQRIPFYPVLGNHEKNAKNYFDYMSLPAPEYFYEFTYGNTQFFMIDSNRNIDPGSEQFEWLRKRLAESTAQWKIACHHHPPYSSDEDDYGDLWKANKSSQGDLRARELSRLYDEFHVDIVWNGHIHSYERTWPVRKGEAVERNGTVYMVTGGAGGGLETAGPFRPYFQNNVKHGHHYCMVMVNGGTLEIKAFDLDERLF
ncbi:MAG: metallophosphoesterase, partial [Planctomycetota bacterium]|nr:metallophosphoesterase [Planctomycetota bacterium]